MPEKSNQQMAAEGDIECFRHEGGPFVVAADETRMPMVFADAKEERHPIIFANDSFLKLSGYEREEILGRDFTFLMAPDCDPAALALVHDAFEGRGDQSCEILCRRKDGERFWAALFISPVRGDAGHIAQYFASFVDLTRHRDQEAQSRMLIDELNHRVKNTLTTVQSIVSQVLRSASDPAAIKEAIESRLFALSRSHDLLTSEKWRSAELRGVVESALAPFGGPAGGPQRYRIEGGAVRLPPKAVLALGIALHELATNAAKYGAFSVPAGCVRVDWRVEPSPTGDRLVLHWREEGGPPVTPPAQKGFGSRVIERGLPFELNGTTRLDFDPGGVACTVDIPVPRVGNG